MVDNPITRKEKYLAKLTGSYTGNVPAPITRVEKYLYDLCQKGISGLTPEEIENAVNKYLKENPVQPGATEEQAQQIKKNTDDVASLKEDLSNKITKFYASSQGETHLADSDNGKIMDMMLYGKSEQKQYSGKNLFDFHQLKPKAPNITTVTTTEDAIIVSSNAQTFTGAVKIYEECDAFKGKTITISANIVKADNFDAIINFGCGLFYENAWHWKLQKVTDLGARYITVIVPETITKIQFILNTNDSNVAKANTITVSKYMVEYGSEATSYEPYVGGQPSPSPDYPQEIKSVVNPTVKIAGKNLLNATLQTTTKNGVTCTANGDGTYTLNGTATSVADFWLIGSYTNNIKIPLNPTKKYVLKGTGHNTIQFHTGTAEHVIVSENGDDLVLTNMSGVAFVLLRINNGFTANNLIIYPQLEEGSATTTYEPYHEQTVTLPYTLNAIPVSSGGNVTIDGQQYIADYVDVERGKLVRMVDSSKLDNTQSIVNKTEWLLAKPQEIDLTQEEVQTLKELATYYPVTNISVNSEQLDGYTVFNYPISMANIITSLKTKTENLESANYTDRGTLADTDAFLINDGTGMKKSVLSKLSDFVLNKIADKVFEKLQTNNKTILGAINELNIIIGTNNAAAHNSIYRGKNLGTQFTAEMSANIKNGTFKDLYCGDYLVINGTTYRFMDFDYLYKTGDTSLDTHHILVVPDAPMYNHAMNGTNTTEGGYVGSKMYISGLEQALAKIKADFGESHIVTYRNLLVNTVSNGAPSNRDWYSRQIDLMNEEMVYGTRAWSQASQNGFDTGTNKSQLAAFKHNHSLISSCRLWYWLRAVRSSAHFCYVGSDGDANYRGASNSFGVRPWFLIS